MLLLKESRKVYFFIIHFLYLASKLNSEQSGLFCASCIQVICVKHLQRISYLLYGAFQALILTSVCCLLILTYF